MTAIDPAQLLPALIAGDLDRVTVTTGGRLLSGRPVPEMCYPGSFNPLHAGHVELARVAAARGPGPLSFELSVLNADKPALSVAEVWARLGQFTGRFPVELTREPTFAGKATVLPGTTFVAGADTARRLVDPSYYGGSTAVMTETLEGMWGRGVRFLVAGRLDPTGLFLTLDALAIPARWRSHFVAIPEAEFRVDLSSSELRDL